MWIFSWLRFFSEFMFSKAVYLFQRFTSFFFAAVSFTLEQIADSISYISMMNGFEITGDWQQALQLLQHVQHQKLEADCFSLNFGLVDDVWLWSCYWRPWEKMYLQLYIHICFHDIQPTESLKNFKHLEKVVSIEGEWYVDFPQLSGFSRCREHVCDYPEEKGANWQSAEEKNIW